MRSLCGIVVILKHKGNQFVRKYLNPVGSQVWVNTIECPDLLAAAVTRVSTLVLFHRILLYFRILNLITFVLFSSYQDEMIRLMALEKKKKLEESRQAKVFIKTSSF